MLYEVLTSSIWFSLWCYINYVSRETAPRILFDFQSFTVLDNYTNFVLATFLVEFYVYEDACPGDEHISVHVHERNCNFTVALLKLYSD